VGSSKKKPVEWIKQKFATIDVKAAAPFNSFLDDLVARPSSVN